MDSRAIGFAKQASATARMAMWGPMASQDELAETKEWRSRLGRRMLSHGVLGAAVSAGAAAVHPSRSLSPIGLGVLGGLFGGAVGVVRHSVEEPYPRKKQAGISSMLGRVARKVITPKRALGAGVIGAAAVGGAALQRNLQRQAPMAPGELMREKRRREIARYGSY